jgi:hypothetical protein
MQNGSHPIAPITLQNRGTKLGGDRPIGDGRRPPFGDRQAAAWHREAVNQSRFMTVRLSGVTALSKLQNAGSDTGPVGSP